MKQQGKNEKKSNTDYYSEKEKLDEIDELLYSYFKQNREIPESTSKVIETTLYTEKSTKTKLTKICINLDLFYRK